MRTRILSAVTIFVSTLAGSAVAETLMLGHPAISSDQIAFTYAGDIWVAQRDGSDPRRLTVHPGTEITPHFSPDGSRIAFSANYEGNTDVYVISSNGGAPQRLTWHPRADYVRGWSADGSSVAFASDREVNGGRSDQLFHVSLEGGMPEKQMRAAYFQGDWHEEGRTLAYIDFGPAYNGLFGGSSGWSGYRGGTSPSIKLMDMAADELMASIPGDRTSEIYPMFAGDDVLFLSDRGALKRFNIYRYDASSSAITQLTDEDEWDAMSMDLHGDTVIYESGGQLKTLSLETGAINNLSIEIDADLPQRRVAQRKAMRNIESAKLSNTGKRALVTARGDVFTIPTADGTSRNLTSGSGDRAYSALWSPMGDRLAYVHDDGQNQSLIIRGQRYDRDPDLELDFSLGDGFNELLTFTPNGQHIVFEDDELRLRLIDLESGAIETILKHYRRNSFNVSVSPNGRWLATTRESENFMQDLILIDLENLTAPPTVLTDGMADIDHPAFGPEGKLLYFTASTNSGPTQVGLDLSSQERPYRAGIYIAVLSDEEKSPLADDEGDEEVVTHDSDEEDDSETEVADDESSEAAMLKNPASLVERMVALPVAEDAYFDLAVAENGDLLILRGVQPGTATSPPGESRRSQYALLRWSSSDKELTTVTTGVTGLTLSGDGKKMLALKGGGTMLFGDASGDKFEPLDASGLLVMIDPQAEWRQIFNDVVRMEAKYFYDPNMHGLDWERVAQKYEPLLAHVGRREDLNTLLVRMIAEMQAGHNRVGGGDVYRGSSPGIGLLGADFVGANGSIRIAKIYSGGLWNPYAKAPLAEPGLDVAEGDYLVSVNGQPVSADDNLFRHLQGTRGQQVSLGVASNPSGEGQRFVTVTPIASEQSLRLWSWVEGNRRTVDELSGGRIGYVYLPNTAGAGFTFFNRMFFPQTNKDAIIFDERSNGGGQAANYITEVLSRRYLSGWKDRHGATFNTPGGAHFGPKLMLIDQSAGSGGDFLPYAFRLNGIGPLMGTRTWGGLIGISANPSLIDGGRLTVPYFRFFDVNYEWTVENQGVAPDIEVHLDPVRTNAGEDSQLSAAVEKLLEDLETFEPSVPTKAPPYPTELGQ